MAKRKKRRPAGPPPAVSPKVIRQQERADSGAKPARAERAVSGSRREPVPPSWRSVGIRAAIIAAVYYVILVVARIVPPGPALLVAIFGFALMLPIGFVIDRWRYRRELRRLEARRGG